MGFTVNSVVVTLYKNQVSVDKFIKKLERNGIKNNQEEIDELLNIISSSDSISSFYFTNTF